jgi:hypothetical protein
MARYIRTDFAVCVCCSVAISILSACASQPAPRVVPLERAMDIPVFVRQGEPLIIAGAYRHGQRDLPEEGTVETTDAKSTGRPWYAARSPGLAGAIENTALLVVLAAGAVNAVAGGISERTRDAQRAPQLTHLLSEEVASSLNDALGNAFKATVGWTRPNLTEPPQWVRWYGPEAQAVQTVNMPALVLELERVQILEPTVGAGALVICGSTSVVGGTVYRTFQTCSYEAWPSVQLSTADEREMFITNLAAASTRLGQAMAKGVLRH